MTWKDKNTACTNFISFGGLLLVIKNMKTDLFQRFKEMNLCKAVISLKKIQMERKENWNLGSELSGEKPLKYFVIQDMKQFM